MEIIIIYFGDNDNRGAMHVRSRLRIALGTFVAVEAEAPSEAAAESGMAAAFDAIAKLERPESDVALLSASRIGAVVSVAPWTWEVLELCHRLHRVSRGAFDPCLNSAPGRLPDVELLDDSRVRVHAPVSVDLGGVAKGYAVDRALESMRATGCTAGLVNAGGDLAVFGESSRTLVCEIALGNAVAVELKNAALATSDTNNLSRPAQHRGYYHGTNRDVPVGGRVTVTAPSAAVADALTKCLLAAPDLPRRAMLEPFGAGLVLQNATPNPRSRRVKSEFMSNH
jgi:FAD:protein FMN transferase